MNQQNNALPCCLNLIFCFSKDFERQENEKKKTRKPFCWSTRIVRSFFSVEMQEVGVDDCKPTVFWNSYFFKSNG